MSFKEYAKDQGLKILGFVIFFVGVLLLVAPLVLSGLYGIPVGVVYVCIGIGVILIIFGLGYAAYRTRRMRGRQY